MKTIEACPICNTKSRTKFIECIDYTTTQESFSINSCTSCGFKYTDPRPEESVLYKYYESDSYISHTNESKGLLNKVYQIVRKYTIIKKIGLLKQLHPKGTLLDIGCGTGEFLYAAHKSGWSTQGIEPSKRVREKAIQQYSLVINEENHLNELETSSFDLITMWHVLEHVPDLNKRLQDISRLLKPNGKIIIAVPNCNSYDAKVYGRFWAAYDVPRHLYHFTPKDIKLLSEKHLLKIEAIKPMLFDSFYVSLLSCHYNKTSIPKALRTGLLSNMKAAIKNDNSYSSQIYILSKS